VNIKSLSEKIPIEETIKAIEFIKYERHIEKLKEYLDDLMPFGEKAAVKYRNKFIQRFVEIDGQEIIYSPILKFINGIDSFQVKKEVIFFIVCTTSDAVGQIVKAFSMGIIPKSIDSNRLLDIFSESMPEAKESSVNKTYSIVTTILNDFNIINSKNDEERGDKVYVLNINLRPSNEGILFNLYYEFLNIRGNKMPEEKLFLECDTFKCFLMSDLMKKRYIKWMIDKKYLELYVMGGNANYQFAFDSLDLLVEQVIDCD